jgi:hypothetical protein
MSLDSTVTYISGPYPGEELYEELKLDGIKNLHELCDLYIAELEKFVVYGRDKGFIT